MAVRFSRYFQSPRPSITNRLSGEEASSSMFNLMAPIGATFSEERRTEFRLRELQRNIVRLQGQIVPRELTIAQRRSAGDIPRPQAVQDIAGGASWGRAYYPPPGIQSSDFGLFINRQLSRGPLKKIWPDARRTLIALESQSAEEVDVPLTLRHEIGHHVLASQGIPSGEHERLLAQAEPHGTTRGIDYRLLQTAIEAFRTPTAEQQMRLSRRRLRLAFRELRRQRR